MAEYEVVSMTDGKVLLVKALSHVDALLTVIGWADEIIKRDGYLEGGGWKVICHPACDRSD
jgi:hypothetical protein